MIADEAERQVIIMMAIIKDIQKVEISLGQAQRNDVDCSRNIWSDVQNLGSFPGSSIIWQYVTS